jgi:hypothetical protein
VTELHSYRIAGLDVSSEIMLPGLIAVARPAGRGEVRIRRAPVPRVLEGATESGPTFQIAGDRFLFQLPGIARFLLQEGRDIAFECENGTSEDDTAVFIIGTVFGILLHQRGQIVLHASAVRVNGRAVLFCGASGAGKSTMAAALGGRGYAMVTDDVCAITTEDGAPMVQPDGRQLKLWEQAVENLELAPRLGGAVRKRLRKFYVEPFEATATALPLGAVYVLREARPPLKDGIERPNVVDSALLIRRNAYRPRLVAALQQRPQYFVSAAAMIASAGLFNLSLPKDFASLPKFIDLLEKHWSEIGLRDPVA